MAKQYLPHDLKPWATDANYAAGVNPWSGQPTKVQPPALLATTGLVPGTKLAAEHENWLKARNSIVGQHAIYAALQRWRSYTVNDSPNATAGIGGYSDGVALGGMLHSVSPYNASLGGLGTVFPNRQLLIAVYEGTNFAYKIGSPGGHWYKVGTGEISGLTRSVSNPASVNGEYGDRVFFASMGDPDVTRSVDSMNTFATDANVSPNAVASLHMSHNGSKRMFAGLVRADTSTQRVATHDTGGGSAWTLRTLPAAWNVSGLHVWNFADNGAGTILASGNKDGEIVRSTDNGNTWGAVTVPFNRHAAAANTCYGLAWSPNAMPGGCFMLTGTGCAVSADGSSWTTRSGMPERGTLTSHQNRNLLAASGPVFAHVFNIDLAGGVNNAIRGVWFTLDAGLTWQEAVFGKVNSGSDEQLIGVTAYNEGFCAWDGAGHVYISDPLAIPDPLYTFV